MEIFTKKSVFVKAIPIFFALLTLFSVIPSCVLADDQSLPPSPDSEGSFEQMKTRMTESVNRTIETLENSKENLDNESSIESAQKLITDLDSIKEEISSAETEDELLKLRSELDTLLDEAPEELKNIPGLIPQSKGPGPGMQDGNGSFSQGFENNSEKRPEIAPDGNQSLRDANSILDSNGMREKGSTGTGEMANMTEESIKETPIEPGFFGKIINALKSIFS